MSNFSHFIGVDWTGAKGSRHPGFAVALCEKGSEAPQLVAPPSGRKVWSRSEFLEWLIGGMGLPDTAQALVGFDSSFSLPFIDESSFLPGQSLPNSATGLWEHVDQCCDGAEDFYGGPFVEAHPEYYHRSHLKGSSYSRRMRVAEQIAMDTGAGPCESVFHLIGPSQVGLSGLSTLRVLNQLKGIDDIAIWPMKYNADHKSSYRIVIVEIYAALFAKMGGVRGKIRDRDTLNKALGALGSDAIAGFNNSERKLTDHAADALVTAAGLRTIAGQRKYWHPEQLSTRVRDTEGWIFGLQ